LIVDAGKPFVQATYKLEGDNILAFRCYEIISALNTSVVMENYPNVQAVVKRKNRCTIEMDETYQTLYSTCHGLLSRAFAG